MIGKRGITVKRIRGRKRRDGKMSKIIGRIDVVKERLRDKYDPDYHAYVFVENKELPIGEFDGYDFEKWNYVIKVDIEISEIKKPITPLPNEVRRWKRALKTVDPGKWNLFLLTVYSKLDKHETECELQDWLREEEYHTTVFVHNAPKVMSREIVSTIPITEEMFNKTLNKLKSNTSPPRIKENDKK